MLLNNVISVFGQQLRIANGVSSVKTLNQTGQPVLQNSAADNAFEFYAVAIFHHLPDKQFLKKLQNASI